MKIMKQFHYPLKRKQCIPEGRNTQSTIDILKEYAMQLVRLPMFYLEDKYLLMMLVSMYP